MNKEKFLVYFKKKSQSKDDTDGIQITNQCSNFTDRKWYFCGACLCRRRDAKDIRAPEKISSRNSCED